MRFLQWIRLKGPLPVSMRALAVIAGLGVLASCAEGQASLPFADHGLMGKTALVLGSVVCSTVYTPVKAVYATGGTLTGGLVFLMSAGQSSTAAGRMIARTTGGDWYIHPDHLTGNRRLEFRATGSSGVDTRDW